MAEFNADKLSERVHLEQFNREQPATTKKPERAYRLPGREASTRTAKRLGHQTGDIEAVLDGRTVLRHLAAGLDHDHDDDYRPIRGIMTGVAVGALLWIPLITVLANVI